ncbi:MAG: hypothetical protein AAGD96_12130, partial [Chloroflexota bacterium]
AGATHRHQEVEYGDEFKAYMQQVKTYAQVTNSEEDVVFYDPAVSVQYTGPEQLIELGVLKSAKEII